MDKIQSLIPFKKPKRLSVGNELHHHSIPFIEKLMPYLDILQKYFRYEAVGVEHIPAGKPCLVVMNHGIIPYHGFLLTKSVIEKRGIYPRGLGASFLFQIPFLRDFFLKGGAVDANPRNARALLAKGHCVMLAPGGIYEGLIARPGHPRIPWQRKKGFVRIAVEMKVPIVPTYCHGINEVYFNSMLFIKERVKLLKAVRFSMPIFFGLGLIPLPEKLTHLVGKPIPITRKKGESREKQVERIHHQVIESMKSLAAISGRGALRAPSMESN